MSPNQKIYFVADTHFWHNNIIRYCNRPFANTFYMNKAIVERWNSVVAPNDHVYHLGDVCFQKSHAKYMELMNSLNGYKFLITGNHDKRHFLEPGFNKVFDDNVTLVVEGKTVYCSHYPLASDALAQSWAHVYLYGHVHNRPLVTYPENHICVSVELLDYTPRTLVELIDRKASHGPYLWAPAEARQSTQEKLIEAILGDGASALLTPED